MYSSMDITSQAKSKEIQTRLITRLITVGYLSITIKFTFQMDLTSIVITSITITITKIQTQMMNKVQANTRTHFIPLTIPTVIPILAYHPTKIRYIIITTAMNNPQRKKIIITIILMMMKT